MFGSAGSRKKARTPGFKISRRTDTETETRNMYTIPRVQWTSVKVMGALSPNLIRVCNPASKRGREHRSSHSPKKSGKTPSSTTSRKATLRTTQLYERYE